MALTDINPHLLFEEIQANQMRLDNCPRHHFPTMPDAARLPYMIGLKLDCATCGGSIDALQAYAYTRGYAAAGGNPNDVIPGWE